MLTASGSVDPETRGDKRGASGVTLQGIEKLHSTPHGWQWLAHCQSMHLLGMCLWVDEISAKNADREGGVFDQQEGASYNGWLATTS